MSGGDIYPAGDWGKRPEEMSCIRIQAHDMPACRQRQLKGHSMKFKLADSCNRVIVLLTLVR
jgi:hypothetical protein